MSSVYEVEFVEIIKRTHVVAVQAVDEDDAVDKAFEMIPCEKDDEVVDCYVHDITYVQPLGLSEELMHYD